MVCCCRDTLVVIVTTSRCVEHRKLRTRGLTLDGAPCVETLLSRRFLARHAIVNVRDLRSRLVGVVVVIRWRYPTSSKTASIGHRQQQLLTGGILGNLSFYVT